MAVVNLPGQMMDIAHRSLTSDSIDEVERITRLDFFSALPDNVEERIEAEYDLAQWP